MKKLLAWFLGGIFPVIGIAQLQIILDKIPGSTPVLDKIYIAGNFNQWNPSSSNHILTLDQGNWQIHLNIPAGALEFKFTRGAWSSVEGTENGQFIPNRKYYYDGSKQTVHLNVAGWEDLDKSGGGQQTRSPNVRIISDNFYLPLLNKYRRIWIYLPPSYNFNTDKRFPVLYMHDGQNLFDASTSFAGEWSVDETLDDLYEKEKFELIVIGIDNGGTSRINELTPWTNPQYGGGQGDLYMQSIISHIKTYVDSAYRTLPDPANTGIMGSSLGGLVSHYAIWKYQNVFSKAGIFSPSYWFSNESFLLPGKLGLTNRDLKIYSIGGKNEGGNMEINLIKMEDVYRLQQLPQKNINTIIHPDGQHNEGYWKREFGAAVKWLFSFVNVKNKDSEIIRFQVFPCPALDQLILQSEYPIEKIRIYDQLGIERLSSQLTDGASIDISSLPKGIYFLEAMKNRKLSTQRFSKF